jgi:hypothetical protein
MEPKPNILMIIMTMGQNVKGGLPAGDKLEGLGENKRLLRGE